MKNTDSHIELLLKKISNYARKKQIIIFSERILNLITVALIILLFYSFIESYAYFTPSIKKVLLALFVLALISYGFYVLTKLVLDLNKSKQLNIIEQYAVEIGEKLPKIKDKLVNSLQIITDQKNRDNKLANAAFNSLYNEIEKYDFQGLIDKIKLNSKLKIFSVVFAIALFFVLITPIRSSLIRLLNYNKEFKKPLNFSLTVIDGNKKKKKGSDTLIKIKGDGKLPSEIYLYTKSNTEVEYTSHILKKDSNNYYTKPYKNLNNSFEYFAQSEDVKTDIFNIDIISPPIITELNLEIIPPKYSKIKSYSQVENGNINALKGSNIKFNIKSSKNILEAKLISEFYSDSLEINNLQALGNFILTKNDKYHFLIKDEEGLANENPIEYSVNVIEDLYPEIIITRPEQYSLIPNSDIVSINYEIKDDYGFTKVILNYFIQNPQGEKKAESKNSIPLKISKSELNQSLFYNWDVSKLMLRENEVINFYLQVFDNDDISGPKSTKSNLFQLRVPTLDELFAQSDEIQNNAVEDLTETLKEAHELSEEFNELNNELKKNEKEIEWSEKDKVENTVKKFNELTNKIDSIKQNLEEMNNKLMENNLLSKETLEKYNELQKLMDEIGSEELKNALNEMQKSLENLLRDDVQKSLEKLSLNEKMFQKSIERTLNLLKKIQVEQKVNEIIKRTEKLAKDINRLTEKAEQNKNGNEKNNEELKESQNKTTEQLSKLEKEMDSLTEKMNELQNMPIKEMQDISQNFKSQNNQELSKSAKENFENQNIDNAIKQDQQLMKNISSIQEQMQNLQKQMQQQSKQMVMQQMLKSIDNVLTLSNQQEELKKRTNILSSKPEELQKLSSEQLDLQQGLDNVLKQLNELSQNTFAISPELGELIGNARKSMYQAITDMYNKNGQRSSSLQGQALGNLNTAAQILQKSLQSMMQGGGQGGGGMMSLMQQLQQMAKQQMGINQLTQSMKGNLNLQQQAQMQRIAKQQAALQKSLQELNREAKLAGQSKKIASNLEKILNDMKEVVSGLNTKQIDDQLVKKQERILSKLLDTQISLNERDFEENRKSRVGKNISSTAPSELILNNLDSDNLLREELLKSLQENYSNDYKELIIEYYKQLEKNLNSTNSN